VKGLIDDVPYDTAAWDASDIGQAKFIGNIMVGDVKERRQAWWKFFGTKDAGMKGVASADMKAYKELLDNMGYLKMREQMHNSWLSNSQGNWGGVMKHFNEKLTGQKTHYHHYFLNKDAEDLKKYAERVARDLKHFKSLGFTPKMIEDFLKMEQEFLIRMMKKSGLVNADGTVTLYRGIDFEYFKNRSLDVEVGDVFDFIPNSAESWSLSKNVAQGFIDGQNGYIMRANVDVEQLGMGVMNWATDAGSLMQEGEIIVNNLYYLEVELLFP
jgi:hypothetical protein